MKKKKRRKRMRKKEVVQIALAPWPTQRVLTPVNNFVITAMTRYSSLIIPARRTRHFPRVPFSSSSLRLYDNGGDLSGHNHARRARRRFRGSVLVSVGVFRGFGWWWMVSDRWVWFWMVSVVGLVAALSTVDSVGVSCAFSYCRLWFQSLVGER